MTRPQPGIFAEGSTAHYALEFTVGEDGAALAGALRQACTDAGGTNMVLAFSGSAWSSLGGNVPARLRGFTYHDSRDLIGFVDGTANPKAMSVWRRP